MDFAKRLESLEYAMSHHKWDYRFCEDSGEWLRHQDASDFIMRESYELRVAGYDEQVDVLWSKHYRST